MRAIGAKPIKGVIFTGAPGTGKTHLARIIANVADAQFYLVSGPTIVSKYVGDSEETLRMIFAAAQSDKRRRIIFFDEIDSIASSRETDHERRRQAPGGAAAHVDGRFRVQGQCGGGRRDEPHRGRGSGPAAPGAFRLADSVPDAERA